MIDLGCNVLTLVSDWVKADVITLDEAWRLLGLEEAEVQSMRQARDGQYRARLAVLFEGVA